MYMDGAPIFPEDPVYDLINGSGKIVKLLPQESRFIVDFGNKMMAYRVNGSGPFTMRTLYWHNPVPGAPPKDDAAFGFYRELCISLAKFCAERTELVNKLLESNNGVKP